MKHTVTPLYPLKFTPVYKEKVWGGRTLENLGRTLPGDANTPIGESWELVDLATTSTSGGGGGAERSAVANGPLAGQTLAQVIDAYGPALCGALPLTEDGGFPILLKYLDASANLSVQVHPSPAYAASHADAFLKSEAWYIVDCQPGAAIYKGIREGVTPDQLRAALATNTDDAVVPLMIEVPVAPGDCHYLPSGTCHALGGGILVAEVQTPSDTTYRVYDWGRTERELHVEQALACIDFGPPQVASFELNTPINDHTTRLVSCEHFRMDRTTAEAGHTAPAGHNQPTVWMVTHGALTLKAGDQDVPCHAGDTVLLPPNGNTTHHVTQDATWIEVSFPAAEAGTLA